MAREKSTHRSHPHRHNIHQGCWSLPPSIDPQPEPLLLLVSNHLKRQQGTHRGESNSSHLPYELRLHVRLFRCMHICAQQEFDSSRTHRSCLPVHSCPWCHFLSPQWWVLQKMPLVLRFTSGSGPPLPKSCGLLLVSQSSCVCVCVCVCVFSCVCHIACLFLCLCLCTCVLSLSLSVSAAERFCLSVCLCASVRVYVHPYVSVFLPLFFVTMLMLVGEYKLCDCVCESESESVCVCVCVCVCLSIYICVCECVFTRAYCVHFITQFCVDSIYAQPEEVLRKLQRKPGKPRKHTSPTDTNSLKGIKAAHKSVHWRTERADGGRLLDELARELRVSKEVHYLCVNSSSCIDS